VQRRLKIPAGPPVIGRLFERLSNRFGPQRWWPADSAWEMMVGAILTQNTAWTNVEKALAELKRAGALSRPALARVNRRRLEKLIRSSGYFRQKAERLQNFAREMTRDPGFFRQLTRSGKWTSHSNRARRFRGGSRRDAALLRSRLLALKGIGPETADSMLLYAGAYPVFVVDAYTRRIGRRMGFFQTDDYDEVQTFFERSFRRGAAAYNEFHALLVRLAKENCTKRHPACRACVVRDLCAHGKNSKNEKNNASVFRPDDEP